MTKVVILENAVDNPQDIASTLISTTRECFDRYDNPFEKKWTIRKLNQATILPYHIARLKLMDSPATWWVSRILDVPISHADWSHYGGVFIYDQSDYLSVHVDAGRHPKSGLVKVATACLYLTKAELEFWHGEPGHYSKPTVEYVNQAYRVEAGTLVLFTNTNDAWHSVPIVKSENGPRVCITCSYLAPEDFKHSDYSNVRTRAYFARKDCEPIDDTLEALREARASETHYSEVYRV